jgi:hypothetical protein
MVVLKSESDILTNIASLTIKTMSRKWSSTNSYFLGEGILQVREHKVNLYKSNYSTSLLADVQYHRYCFGGARRGPPRKREQEWRQSQLAHKRSDFNA